MSNVPYNTGKVRIGSRYEPPKRPVYLSNDEERLQKALLGVKGGYVPTSFAALYAIAALSAIALICSV
jgi:hypothetical protein